MNVDNSLKNNDIFKIFAALTIIVAHSLNGVGKALTDELGIIEERRNNGQPLIQNGGQGEGGNVQEPNQNLIQESNPNVIQNPRDLGKELDEIKKYNGANDDESYKAVKGFILRLVDFFENIKKLGVKKTFQISSKLLDYSLGKVVPKELINTPYSQLNPQLSERLKLLTDNIEQFTNDPEAKLQLELLTKAYTKAGLDITKAALPNINGLFDELGNLASTTSRKMTETAVNTAVSSMMAAVANIPVVGSLAIAFIQGGELLKKGTMSFFEVLNSAQKVSGKVNGTIENINRAVDDLKGEISNVIRKEIEEKKKALSLPKGLPNVNSGISNVSPYTGGRYKRKTNNKCNNRTNKSKYSNTKKNKTHKGYKASSKIKNKIRNKMNKTYRKQRLLIEKRMKKSLKGFFK